MMVITNLTIREFVLECSKDTESREKEEVVRLLFSLTGMFRCSMNELFIDAINACTSEKSQEEVEQYRKNLSTENYITLCEYLESKGLPVNGEFFKEFTAIKA